MKKLFVLIGILLLASCSSDDSPKRTILLTKITSTSDEPTYNLEYNIEYDNQKRIKQIVRTGGTNAIILYKYNDDNLVSSIIVSQPDIFAEIKFKYDSDKRLISYSTTDTTIMVDYDEETAIYTANGIVFYFNDQGDMTSIYGNIFSYDTSKNGLFTNCQVNYHFINAVSDTLLFLIGTKKPMVKAVNEEGEKVYEFVHTYNKNNFPEHTEINGSINVSLDFEYSEL